MLPENLPAQFYATPLTGCSVRRTSHLGGSKGGLSHVQGLNIIFLTKKLHSTHEKHKEKKKTSIRNKVLHKMWLSLYQFCYLVADISCKLDKIVFKCNVSSSCVVFSSAAYMTDRSLAPKHHTGCIIDYAIWSSLQLEPLENDMF